MAQTKAKPATAPRSGSTTPDKTAKGSAAATKEATVTRRKAAPKSTAAPRKSAVDTTAELTDDVLKAVESGQRAAIEAVHRFLETVDEALPAIGERPSRREQVIDAALEMADRLTTTQYEFLRTVVRSADRSLGSSDTAGK